MDGSDKACQYCKLEKMLNKDLAGKEFETYEPYGYNTNTAFIAYLYNYGKYVLIVGGNFEFMVPINYCPMCSRKLGE